MTAVLLYHFGERYSVLNLTEADELPKLYRLLHCDLVTIPRYRIGGELYDIIADDEGLLKESPKVALFLDGQPTIAGRFIITRYNDEGEQIGLDDSDIDRILEHTKTIIVTTEQDDGEHTMHYALELRSTNDREEGFAVGA